MISSSDFKKLLNAINVKHLERDQEKRKENNIAFAEKYDASKYTGIFATADIVVFTLDADYNLCLLLIQRKDTDNYEAGIWALPGGFIETNESSYDAAVRELQEETGITNIHIEQFGTFDDPKRDLRSRIISIAHMAFVPMEKLGEIKGSDDAQAANLFAIRNTKDNELFLINENKQFYITESDLGFDHKQIIKTALKRLSDRFAYTKDIFEFVKDKNAFTATELKKIWGSVTDETIDSGNFRRDVIQKYLDKHVIEDTGKKTAEFSKRPATIYKKT